MNNVLATVGILLVVGVFAGGGVAGLTDWSTAEMVGANIATVAMLAIGVYLIYHNLIKRT